MNSFRVLRSIQSHVSSENDEKAFSDLYEFVTGDHIGFALMKCTTGELVFTSGRTLDNIYNITVMFLSNIEDVESKSMSIYGESKCRGLWLGTHGKDILRLMGL